MRRLVYALFSLFLLCVACMEQRPASVSHNRDLMRIDSMLQQLAMEVKVLRHPLRFHPYKKVGSLKETPISFRGQEVMQGFTVSNHPLDTLLFVLKNYPPEHLKNEADSFYHSFLMMELFRIRGYYVRSLGIVGENISLAKYDTLLQQVVDYYDRVGDAPKQAKLHTFMGEIYRHSIYTSFYKSARELLKAEPIARQLGDHKLLTNIYLHLGNIYYWRNFYSKSDSIYRLACQSAVACKDSFSLAEALYYRLDIKINHFPYLKDISLKSHSVLNYDDNSALIAECMGPLEIALKSNNMESAGNIYGLIAYLYYMEEDLEEALRYARQSYSLTVLSSGRILSLMGDIFGELGMYDSLNVYYKMRYGDDWRLKGTGVGRMISYFDSEMSELGSLETKLQMERERAEHKQFVERYFWLFVLLVVVFVGLSVLIYLMVRRNYRRKYHLQLAQLDRRSREGEVLYAALRQDYLNQEAEIHRLQAEVERLGAEASETSETPEPALAAISTRLTEASKKRAILAKEAVEHSAAYNKIQLIITDCKWNGISKQQLADNEWQELQTMLNACSNDTLLKLQQRITFTDRELQTCCLLLMDLPVAHIAYVMRHTRPTIYRIEREILEKLHIPYEKGKLRSMLLNGI
ncbi:MAG: hypothetical protein IJ511_04910 [Bacteroides sp.]|nr:hypothetical protein [Bacteroides sp.]